MAGQRKTVPGTKRRSGLRSQASRTAPQLMKEDVDWESALSGEEQDQKPIEYEQLGARPKTGRVLGTTSFRVQPAAESSSLGEVVRKFLVAQMARDDASRAAQMRRDDAMREELRKIATAMHPRQVSSLASLGLPSPSVDESARLELPLATPFRQQQAAQGPEPAASGSLAGPDAVSSQPAPSTANPADQGGRQIPNPNPPSFRRKEPKMPVYQQGEDIENYLLRFERLARTWQWPHAEQACRLVPLLTGKALEAYSAMDEQDADD